MSEPLALDVASHQAAQPILRHVRSMEAELTELIRAMALAESPTDRPETQGEVQTILGEALRGAGLEVRHIPGRETGGHLYARPAQREHGTPYQLLVGHTDTVWPTGTLEEMPVQLQDGRLYGPGTFDMKAGLAQIALALRTLRELGLTPAATPVVLVNSDEETGSPESRRWVERLARGACRAFILEPSFGLEGKLKTARKGVGVFEIAVAGRSAHAGLNPEAGASAILELAHVIQRVHALNDAVVGTTVNVGVIDGGIRPNVVAARARARVDARVVTLEEGHRLEDAMGRLGRAQGPVTVSVSGGIRIPPLERTARNRRLWQVAREAGLALGLDLQEVTAGGGSDGNTTSRFTATLDGLGAVGDGAHAVHEHVDVAATLDRVALLALLLLAPVDPDRLP